MFGLQDSDDEDVEGEIDDQIEVTIEFVYPIFTSEWVQDFSVYFIHIFHPNEPKQHLK